MAGSDVRRRTVASIDGDHANFANFHPPVRRRNTPIAIDRGNFDKFHLPRDAR